MDEGFSPLSMVLFLVFIGLEAAFYGLGSAIQNVSEADLEKDAEEGNKKAKWLLKVMEQPKYFVYSLQAVTNVIGLILGSYVLRSWGSGLGLWIVKAAGWDVKLGRTLGLILAAIVILVVLISFGIVIPKRCGAKKPQYWCYRLVPLVSAVMVPVFPFIMVVTGLSRVILWALRVDITNDNDNVTEEEIMSMVNEGHEQGVLEASEAEMITNIFELDDKEAGDIMTHRTNLVAIDGEMTLKEAVDFILKEGKNSRYPVYEEDIDNIIGVIHEKDFHAARYRGLTSVKEMLGPMLYTTGNTKISELLRILQREKAHMVIVVDEYGGTEGLVTLEDIVEELVGEIWDEHDEVIEEFKKQEDDSYLISCSADLTDLFDLFKIKGECDSNTISGWVMEQVGRVPEEGDHFQAEGLDVIVTRVEHRRVIEIQVRVLPEEEPEAK